MEKQAIRQSIRKWSFRAAWAVIAFPTVQILAGFIQAYGEEQHWFAHPAARVAVVTDILTAVVGWAWFHWVGGIVIGFAAGTWLDAWLRPGNFLAASHPETLVEMKLRYPHTLIYPLLGHRIREREFGKDHYRDRIIDIPLLFDGEFRVNQVIFEDCVLAGPATLNFSKCNLLEVTYLNEFSCEENFIEITDERARYLVTSAYEFVECTFRRCLFYRIAMIGSKKTLEAPRAAIAGAGAKNEQG